MKNPPTIVPTRQIQEAGGCDAFFLFIIFFI
jgi:hypothetical protein